MGKKLETFANFILLGSKIGVDGDSSHKIKRCLLQKKSYDRLREPQRYHFADKSPCSQSCGFSGSHIWMWELNHKEGWMLKNRCFWIVVLENTLESPLDSREIKPVNSKGNQSWIFIGRTGWSSSTLTTWCEEPTHWKRPWCWERLRARGEGGDREWDGWVASLTQWTWVWANSGRW